MEGETKCDAEIRAPPSVPGVACRLSPTKMMKQHGAQTARDRAAIRVRAIALTRSRLVYGGDSSDGGMIA